MISLRIIAVHSEYLRNSLKAVSIDILEIFHLQKAENSIFPEPYTIILISSFGFLPSPRLDGGQLYLAYLF